MRAAVDFDELAIKTVSFVYFNTRKEESGGGALQAVTGLYHRPASRTHQMAGRREEQGEVGSRPAARAQYPEQAAPYCSCYCTAH